MRGARHLLCGMRIRVSAPELLDDLLAFLRSKPDAVVDRVSVDELEVSLLGSYNDDAMRMELYLRVRTWEEAQRGSGTLAEIVD